MKPQGLKKILITGAAGFIGYHVVNRFLSAGCEVVGLDSINDYYNPQLKFDRLADVGVKYNYHQWREMVNSETYSKYRFIRSKLEDKKVLQDLFQREDFDQVIHLAAQPGVRYSLKYPEAYIESNIIGFLNILEACRHHGTKHLVFASSSSVYGNNQKMPLSTSDNVDHPVSLYAATKKSNELMAHTYSHLFKIPVTGLRFFTVYGPWGRPDMATHLFTDAIGKGEKIKVYNKGQLSRDYTYVSDIAEGVFKVSEKSPEPLQDWSDVDGPATSNAPYRLYNIGSSQPIKLMDFISQIELAMGREAEKELLPMQPGDVLYTFADITGLKRDFNWQPMTSLGDGIKQYIDWHESYYANPFLASLEN